MIVRSLAVSSVVFLLAVWAMAQGAATKSTTQEAATQPAGGSKALTAADLSAIAKAVAPSLVKVEYTLQFDKGEPPRAMAGAAGPQLVDEERPMEIGGFALAADKVAIYDPLIHPRFVKSIQVRFGDQVVGAKVAAYGKDKNVAFLTLDKPLKDVKPIAFCADAKGPQLCVWYGLEETQWITRVHPMEKQFTHVEDGTEYYRGPSNCLVVNDKGEAVTLLMGGDIPVTDAWKTPPQKWEMVSAVDADKQLKAIEARAGKCIVRVALSFRSPKKNANTPSYSRGGDEDEGTERNVLGVLADDKTVIVLSNMKRNITSRLERIRIYQAGGSAAPSATSSGPSGSSQPSGEGVTAKFAGTLNDYGAFVAKLDKPLTGSVACCTASLKSLPHKFAIAGDISLRGETFVNYFQPGRVSSLDLGWRKNVYPTCYGGAECFLFDVEGNLVALPLHRRAKAGSEDRYDSGRATMTAFAQLRPVMAELAMNLDASNIPLTEEEESRLAWLGVLLQPLDKELARNNNVSDETHDGATGGLVSYVYPGSPAEKLGIKQGNILLRLVLPDQPKPVEIMAERDAWSGGFPWEELDRLPEQYYDRITPPWTSAEDMISRTLTDAGIGKKAAVEFSADGKSQKKDFIIEQGPTHYDAASKFKAGELGVTVRDLTYEVRRYFQKKTDDPGVLISKVEPGSKASIAGIKPLEMITHVDGQPVKDVAEFQKLVKKQGEVKLSVLRMTKGRQVKVKLTGAESRPTTAATSGPADADEPAAKPVKGKATTRPVATDVDE